MEQRMGRSEELKKVQALSEQGEYFTCTENPEVLYQLFPWGNDVTYLPLKEEVAFVVHGEDGQTWLEFNDNLSLAPNQILSFKRQLDAFAETGKFLNLLDP